MQYLPVPCPAVRQIRLCLEAQTSRAAVSPLGSPRPLSRASRSLLALPINRRIHESLMARCEACGQRVHRIFTVRPRRSEPDAADSYYRQLPLAPLGPEAIRELLEGLLGCDPSIKGLAERIHARTGGNPFYAEEVAQSLIESGSLSRTLSLTSSPLGRASSQGDENSEHSEPTSPAIHPTYSCTPAYRNPVRRPSRRRRSAARCTCGGAAPSRRSDQTELRSHRPRGRRTGCPPRARARLGRPPDQAR